jgi:hypothetical protein
MIVVVAPSSIRNDPDYVIMEKDANPPEENTLSLPRCVYYSLLSAARQRKLEPFEYLEQLVDRETCAAISHERHWNRSVDLF